MKRFIIIITGCFHGIQLKENSLLEGGIPWTNIRCSFNEGERPTLEFEEKPIEGKSYKATLIDKNGSKEKLVIKYGSQENAESYNKVFSLDLKYEGNFYYISSLDFKEL